jgi:hypothetical protein
MEGRRWFVGAIAVFSVLLVVWIAAALFLSSASAGSLPISLNLRSHLKADYGSDGGLGPLKVFRLSIINDRLLDGGLSAEEAEARSEAIESAFDLPVPTATALNFRGDAPYTATYTNTPTSTSTSTPLPTNTPTATSTNTPRPTKTPTPVPTDTPEPPPEKPISPATPTKTVVSPGDTTPPEILDWNLDPPSGGLEGCSTTIHINNLKILDKAYSSGLAWIKIKYYDPVKGEWIVFEVAKPPDSPPNWTLGEEWYDHYNFDITIDIGPTGPTSFYTGSGGTFLSMSSGSSPVTCDLSIPLKVWVSDNAGYNPYQEVGTYTIPESCGSD